MCLWLWVDRFEARFDCDATGANLAKREGNESNLSGAGGGLGAHRESPTSRSKKYLTCSAVCFREVMAEM